MALFRFTPAQVLIALGLVVLIVLNVTPLAWGVLTSLKSGVEIARFPPSFFDFAPTLENYQRVVEGGFLDNFRASLIYCAVSVFFVLLLALPTAYAFDRFDFPFKNLLFTLIVACIPLSLGAAALLIPNYLYFSRLGITNTWLALPLIYTAHQLPMAIWIMKGAMESIPHEIDEAARIDGATSLQLLVKIILPLSGPALGATAVVAFIGCWNEFVASSVMVDNAALRPIQPAIYNFIGYFGREWGPLTASATIAIVPVIIVFAFFGRLIVSGMTQGSVKG